MLDISTSDFSRSAADCDLTRWTMTCGQSNFNRVYNHCCARHADRPNDRFVLGAWITIRYILTREP